MAMFYITATLIYYTYRIRNNGEIDGHCVTVISGDPKIKTDTVAEIFNNFLSEIKIYGHPSISEFFNSDQAPIEIDHRLKKYFDISDRHRVPDDLESEVKVTTYEEALVVVGILSNKVEPDYVRNEAMTLLRLSFPFLAKQCLVGILADPTESLRIRAFSVQQLGLLLEEIDDNEDPPTIKSVLREFIRNGESELRRESLYALVSNGDSIINNIRDHGFHDPEWINERDLIIRIAGDNNWREHIEYIRELATNSNVDVRISAIVVLSNWNDIDSKNIFENACKDGNFRLRMAGKSAMERLLYFDRPSFQGNR
jgi:hypothetical protein